MDTNNQQRTKMVHEEALLLLEIKLKEVLSQFPELRSLMVAIDWKIGQDSFPPNIVLTKESNEKTSLEMMKQGVKLLNSLSLEFNKQIFRADSVLREAEKYVLAEKEKKDRS